MSRYVFLLFLCLYAMTSFANRLVNVYIWGGEIPTAVIHQFEDETGINANVSYYDNNEVMYAKLKASSRVLYDVIMPSSYFVERMKRQQMLTPLDPQFVTHKANIEPFFQNPDYDPNNSYSVPLTWGTTGLFFNKQWIKHPPLRWNDLWHAQWRQKLLLLDDPREIFSIALMSLGYNPNDGDPKHIEEAYHKLLQLIPNIKLFASASMQALLIDEDAILGITWNGDAYKAALENKAIQFLYPQDGFVIWTDCLAIPANAPHLKEAYEFINFMLRPDIAAQIALDGGFAIANAKGKSKLPEAIRSNPWLYPEQSVLKNGHFQRDVSDASLALYNQYWQEFKLSF